jgi:predicted AAA+ superfamily ATPase
MNLNLYNPHRKPDYVSSFGFKRDMFDRLWTKIHSRFVKVLIGLRRTGKTTLMRQLIDRLVVQEVPRHHIVFWSFDSAITLPELMNQFQASSSVDLSLTPVYIFLDEIQKLPDRQNQIKIYYDLYPMVYFFVSGSASVRVKKIESLAGRMEQYILEPLSWHEYLRYHNLLYYYDNPKLYLHDIDMSMQHFVHRQFFDTLTMPIVDVKEYMSQLIYKILFEDMVAYYDIKYPDLLKRLCMLYL